MNEELISRLRTSTVADSAESIYQTMADAADEIERLQSQFDIGLQEIERLNELILQLVMLGAVKELNEKEHE